MVALLALLSVAQASAGTLVLPTGEDPQRWQTASRLAGLDLGEEGGNAAGVRLVAASGGWALVAPSATGTDRWLTVPAPTSEEAREEIASLAASLLADLARPTPGTRGVPGVLRVSPAPAPPAEATRPALPASAPAPALPAPSPTPAPIPAPILATAAAAPPAPPPPAALVPIDMAASPPSIPPEAVAPASDTQVSAPVAIPIPAATAEPAPAIEAHPFHPGRWIVVAPAMTWRAGAGTGSLLSVGGGIRVAAFDMGAGVGWQGPRLLAPVADSGTVSAVDFAFSGRWMPDGTIAPLVELEAGGSWRTFRDGNDALAAFAVPFGGLDVGAAVRLGSQLVLAPQARVRRDLAVITVQKGVQAPATLGPWDVGGGLALLGTWR